MTEKPSNWTNCRFSHLQDSIQVRLTAVARHSLPQTVENVEMGCVKGVFATRMGCEESDKISQFNISESNG